MRPAEGRQGFVRSFVALYLEKRLGNDVARISGSVEASLHFRSGKRVIGHDPGFQFARTVEKIYITDPLRVKMINPLLNQLAS